MGLSSVKTTRRSARLDALKRHLPRATESYINSIIRFVLYHHKRQPRQIGAPEVGAFLSHLATKRNVSGPTPSQTWQAILQLYSKKA